MAITMPRDFRERYDTLIDRSLMQICKFTGLISENRIPC